MNKVVLIGRITKDLELKYTQSNIPFTKFTLAVNRTFGDKETDFIQCTAWKKAAENTVKYCHKGSLIGVEGRIQTGSYDNKDGVRVYTTDIMCDNVQFLEPKNQQFTSDEAEQVYNNTRQEKIDVAESDLPF